MEPTDLFEFLKIDKYGGVFLRSFEVMKNENYDLNLLHAKEITIYMIFFSDVRMHKNHCFYIINLDKLECLLKFNTDVLKFTRTNNLKRHLNEDRCEKIRFKLFSGENKI